MPTARGREIASTGCRHHPDASPQTERYRKRRCPTADSKAHAIDTAFGHGRPPVCFLSRQLESSRGGPGPPFHLDAILLSKCARNCTLPPRKTRYTNFSDTTGLGSLLRQTPKIQSCPPCNRCGQETVNSDTAMDSDGGSIPAVSRYNPPERHTQRDCRQAKTRVGSRAHSLFGTHKDGATRRPRHPSPKFLTVR